MNEQEIASKIVDKYWKKSGFKEPNPYLLEADITQALRSVRQEENEACAKVVENYKVECCDGHMFETGDGSDYEDRCPLPLKMSTEIRQRMKEAK